MRAVVIQCPGCGAGLDKTDRLCRFCGNPVQIVEQPVVATEAVPSKKPRRSGWRTAWWVFVILSALDFMGVGVAAIIVNPHWEAEVLMWIALAGTPALLVVLVGWILTLLDRGVVPGR